MATDINNVTLVGRLTNDPQLKYLPSGTAALEFSIANNYYISSKESNEVSYFDIVLFGKTAESLSRFLVKGKQVGVSGTLRQDRWQDKEGSQRSRVRINAQSVQLLASQQGSGDGNSQNAKPYYKEAPASDKSEYGNTGNTGNTGGSGGTSNFGNDSSSFSDDDDVPF